MCKAGQTKEEAVANAKAALQSRLSQGEIVTIDVEPQTSQEDNPLLKHFGRFKDDPTFDDYLVDIEAHRRQVDEEVEEPVKKATGNPWLDSFGTFKDDPTYDDFLEKIAEYRRELDEKEATK